MRYVMGTHVVDHRRAVIRRIILRLLQNERKKKKKKKDGRGWPRARARVCVRVCALTVYGPFSGAVRSDREESETIVLNF